MLRPLAIMVLLKAIHCATADNSTFNYTSQFGYSPRQNLGFPELAKYDGYNVETYNVTTEDGYMLTLFRLPLKKSCPTNSTRKPILIMHGLALSCLDAIMAGPGIAHAYIYADECYDVWVGNCRGNRYGRRHILLNPDKDPVFWNFTFDNMALSDLPAMITTVLGVTGASQLYYVAHSQGITILLILLAKKPEYNAKIKCGFGLSVVSRLKCSRSLVLPVAGGASALFGNFDSSNNFEIFRHGGITQLGVQYLCGVSPLQYPYCSVLIFAVDGYNSFQISEDTLRVVVTNTPAGTSFKNFLRWGEVKNHGFCEKDYGLVKNQEVYGQSTPPLINLSNVTAQLYFFVADNDYVAHPADVHALKTEQNLTNATVECKIPDPTFGHLEFIYSDNIPKYITPHILSVLETGTCNCTRSSNVSSCPFS